MQVIDRASHMKDIYTGSLTNRKRMEIAMQRYALFDLFQCNKSIKIFFHLDL